jgi:bacteriocin-like protein
MSKPKKSPKENPKQAKKQKKELSDEELKTVQGGKSRAINWIE